MAELQNVSIMISIQSDGYLNSAEIYLAMASQTGKFILQILPHYDGLNEDLWLLESEDKVVEMIKNHLMCDKITYNWNDQMTGTNSYAIWCATYDYTIMYEIRVFYPTKFQPFKIVDFYRTNDSVDG